MMSTTMSDDLSTPFTIVKQIDQESVSDNSKQYQWKTSYQHNELVIQVQNIKLVQVPSEMLNLRVEISRDSFPFPSDDMYLHTTLRFSNYLHEFNQNYRYEIKCKITNFDQLRDEYLFSSAEVRLSECVQFQEFKVKLSEQDLKNVSEKGIHFYIRRRFDESINKIDNERLHRAISTLRSTGCDVVLGAKDGDVCTHKSILSQNSEVFQAMFSVDMKEKQSGTIDVADFEKKIVNKMLDYLYTGELGELGDMTESLFKLAHRYQLHDLCRRCEEYFMFNVKVDNDNIVEILKLTDLYELEKLNECAVNFTKRHEQELSTLSSYREYLIQSMNLNNVVARLLSADKYDMKDVKLKTLDFINDNYREIMMNPEFLFLFESEGRLMKEIHVYMLGKKI